MVQNLRPAVARGAKTKQTGRLATSAEKRKMSVVAKNTNPNAKQQKKRDWETGKFLKKGLLLLRKLKMHSNKMEKKEESGEKFYSE